MATKTDAGVEFPSAAYAYVPDAEKPSTWKLRLWESPTDKVTVRQVGMAIAALGPAGFRGNKVEIPSADLSAVKRKVLAAWKSVHDENDEVPNVLKRNEEVGMAITIEELTAQVEKMEQDLSAVTTRAEAAEAALVVSSLNAEDHEAYETLSDDERASFVQSGDSGRGELLAKGHAAIAKRNALPDEIQKRFDEIQKKLETAEARAHQAEEVAKKERDQRRLAQLSKRAEEEFAGLPGTSVEKASVLKSLEDKLTSEEQDAVVKLLKAGNECLRGQMKPVGKGAGADGGGDAWTRIEKRAHTVAAEQKIPFAKAVERVMEENPELYDEYLRSNS